MISLREILPRSGRRTCGAAFREHQLAIGTTIFDNCGPFRADRTRPRSGWIIAPRNKARSLCADRPLKSTGWIFACVADRELSRLARLRSTPLDRALEAQALTDPSRNFCGSASGRVRYYTKQDGPSQSNRIREISQSRSLKRILEVIHGSRKRTDPGEVRFLPSGWRGNFPSVHPSM